MAYAGKSGEVRGIRKTPKSPARVSLTTNTATPRRIGTLAGGIAIGLVIGVGVALLLAPQSGAETRHDIGRGLKRVRRRGRNAWDDLRDELGRARRDVLRARRRAKIAADAASAVT